MTASLENCASETTSSTSSFIPAQAKQPQSMTASSIAAPLAAAAVAAISETTRNSDTSADRGTVATHDVLLCMPKSGNVLRKELDGRNSDGTGRSSDDENATGNDASEHNDMRSTSACLPTIPDYPTAFCSHWGVLLLAQLLSLALASAGATNAMLVDRCEWNAPAFQMSIVYAALSMRYLYLLHKKQRTDKKQQTCEISRKNQGEGNKQQYSERSDGDKRSPILEGHDDFDIERAAEMVTANKRGRTVTSQTEDDLSSDSTTASISHRMQPMQLHAQETLPFASIRISYPWWFYCAVAFFHVQGNVFTFMAFRYTSFQSISLLDSVAIPAAMLSSRWLLRRRYGPVHVLGSCVCIVGSTMLVLGQYEEEHAVDQSIVGDTLAIAGAILFGFNDTVAEWIVKGGDDDGDGDGINAKDSADAGSDGSEGEKGHIGHATEYFALVGLFGTLISAAQCCLFEWAATSRFFNANTACASEGSSGTSAPLLLVGFVVSTYVFYVGMGHFLIFSEAALFNLSMLTGDVWAVLFSIVEEKVFPTGLFFASLAVTMSGVVIYEMAPSPMEIDNEHLFQNNNDLSLSKTKSASDENRIRDDDRLSSTELSSPFQRVMSIEEEAKDATPPRTPSPTMQKNQGN